MSLTRSMNCLPPSTLSRPFNRPNRWFGIFRFFELSNFLFSGARDFINTCVRALRAPCRLFLLSLTLTISLRLISSTLRRLSRKAGSLLKVVAPFYYAERAIYFCQSESETG